MVPPEGLEPSPQRLRAAYAALTPRRAGAATRDRTATCSLPRNRAAVSTMATWSEWPGSNRHRWVGGPGPYHWTTLAFGSACGYRSRSSTLATWHAPPHPGRAADRRSFRRSIDDILQLSKSPLTSSWRQLDLPVWRQRQDSNPVPGVLEAPMLPLHHAADCQNNQSVSRRTPPRTWPRSP
jgi:hypothetical protein